MRWYDAKKKFLQKIFIERNFEPSESVILINY